MIYMDSSIWLLSVIAILVRSPKLVAPFPDLSPTTDFNYKSRDVGDGVSLDVGEVVADQMCPDVCGCSQTQHVHYKSTRSQTQPLFSSQSGEGCGGGNTLGFLEEKKVGWNCFVGLLKKWSRGISDKAKKTYQKS